MMTKLWLSRSYRTVRPSLLLLLLYPSLSFPIQEEERRLFREVPPPPPPFFVPYTPSYECGKKKIFSFWRRPQFLPPVSLPPSSVAILTKCEREKTFPSYRRKWGGAERGRKKSLSQPFPPSSRGIRFGSHNFLFFSFRKVFDKPVFLASAGDSSSVFGSSLPLLPFFE